jgi:hypothetical protein
METPLAGQKKWIRPEKWISQKNGLARKRD